MAKQTVPIVQTADLCKTFKAFWRRPHVEAVKNLSLEIKPGEVFGLLGPNGSGKTTTIKMLLGLLYPTRGRISVFGKPPSDVAVKARIGFLPEESYLYRFLVAHETLDFYGRLFQLPRSVRRERTDRLLDMVGLRHEAKRRVGEYSKGMARRIGLAQALINDPEFLILDEPTSGLDPIGARQIKDVIRDLGRKGKTILLSSHILADVEDVCDRVTILYGGQQQAAGDITDLLRKTDTTQITAPALADKTIAQIRELVRRLEKKDIFDVTNPRVSLEDFFLRIVEEAQAKNIQTSGARSGGKIPEFLQQPTESITRDVVESLVMASSVKVEPAAVKTLATDNADQQRTRQLIDDLMGRSDEEKDAMEVTEVQPQRGEETEASPSDTAVPRSADAGVIEGLLDGGAGGERDRESES